MAIKYTLIVITTMPPLKMLGDPPNAPRMNPKQPMIAATIPLNDTPYR